MRTAAVVVDASVWVSWLITSDINYNASHLWMEQYKITKGLLVAPAILLIEVAASISRQTGQTNLAKEVVKNLSELSSMRLIPLENQLVQISANIAADLKLRAADAVYVAVAYQLKIPLVSWDREQLDRASSLITTYTPDTYP